MGATLIERLGNNRRTTAKPIIVLAADVFPQSRAAVEAAGCDVFLSMPCRPGELLREIQRALLPCAVEAAQADASSERVGPCAACSAACLLV